MTSTTEKTDTQKLSKTKDQQISHGHKLRSPLAPAIHHSMATELGWTCMSRPAQADQAGSFLAITS